MLFSKYLDCCPLPVESIGEIANENLIKLNVFYFSFFFFSSIRNFESNRNVLGYVTRCSSGEVRVWRLVPPDK